jgi:polyisoprenoid-binding protein YceI
VSGDRSSPDRTLERPMLSKLLIAASTFAALALAPAPQSTPAAAPKSPAGGRYDVDNIHSAVMFKVRHLGTSNAYGRFNLVKGTLILDGTNWAEAVLNLEIDAASIDTNDETGVAAEAKDARDTHLRNADFFNVEEFPTIEFESTKVVDKGGGKLEIAGDLTMHGVTKSVTATGEYIGTSSGPRSGTVVGFEAKFTLDRRDFGMNYAVEVLGTEVTVLVSIEARKR